MSPEQISLLNKLIRAANVDQGRVYSATWSVSRLRTLLMHECIKRGLQVVDAYIPGSPASLKQIKRDVAEIMPADLTVLNRFGQKLLTLDLLVGSPEGIEPASTPQQIYNAIVRVTSGHVDGFLMSADVDIYNGLHHKQEQLDGRDTQRIKIFTAVLPPVSGLSVRTPRQITLDDTTLSVVGTRVTAFGGARVICSAYQTPTPGPMFAPT